jgi:hypothetical protein
MMPNQWIGFLVGWMIGFLVGVWAMSTLKMLARTAPGPGGGDHE